MLYCPSWVPGSNDSAMRFNAAWMRSSSLCALSFHSIQRSGASLKFSNTLFKLFLPRSVSKNPPILPSPNSVSGTYHLRIGSSLSDPAGETQLTATYLVGFAFSTLGMTHAARKYISSLILENREHNLTFFRKPECRGADLISLD